MIGIHSRMSTSFGKARKRIDIVRAMANTGPLMVREVVRLKDRDFKAVRSRT